MTLGQSTSHAAVANNQLNYNTLIADYMKDHAIFFNDPSAVSRHLKARLIDDELRASWLDGLTQSLLHLRFLWQDIITATYGDYGYQEISLYKNKSLYRHLITRLKQHFGHAYEKVKFGDALDRLDLGELVDLILNLKELGPVHCLSISLGVYNIRVTRTMLSNIRTLYQQLVILTPFQRLTGFEPIPMADAALYQMPLIANKSNPDFAREGCDNATAALFTIIATIPLGHIWIDKHRALLKHLRSI